MTKSKRVTLLLFVLIPAIVAIVPDAALAKLQLAKPIQVSPTNNTHFQNYPRDTTVVWQPVKNADSYQVDWEFFGSSWSTATSATVTGNLAATYTLTFIGDQPGRWRVTALDSTGTYLSSEPSAWRTFYYTTGLTLPTPRLVSPPEDAQFYNFPRTTTLAWEQVLGATGYNVEIQFESGDVWSSSDVVPVTGLVTTSYTFDFIGAQPGRWRVTATGPASGDNIVNDSAPSVWREFVYHE